MARQGTLTPTEIAPAIRYMKDLGVSEVARSRRGFLHRFMAMDGDWDALGSDRYSGQDWSDRQRNFVARHWKQIRDRKEPLWTTYKGERIPTRHHLALIAWAWTPDVEAYRKWLKGLEAQPSKAERLMAPGYRSWAWTQQDWRSVVKGPGGRLDWSRQCGAEGTRDASGKPALCLPVAVIEELVSEGEAGRRILRQQVEKKSAAKKGQRVPWHPRIAELWNRVEADTEPDRLKSKKPGLRVQSLLFDRDVFTKTDARKWVKSHGFVDLGVDEKPNTWRFRQHEPPEHERDSFRTIYFRPGVQAVVARPNVARSDVDRLEVYRDSEGMTEDAQPYWEMGYAAQMPTPEQSAYMEAHPELWDAYMEGLTVGPQISVTPERPIGSYPDHDRTITVSVQQDEDGRWAVVEQGDKGTTRLPVSILWGYQSEDEAARGAREHLAQMGHPTDERCMCGRTLHTPLAPVERLDRVRRSHVARRREEAQVFFLMDPAAHAQWLAGRSTSATSEYDAALVRAARAGQTYTVGMLQAMFNGGALRVRREGSRLVLDGKVLLAFEQQQDALVSPFGSQPSLFTQTTKMSCPSFSLPAGPFEIGGTCALATHAPNGPGAEELRICSNCYALKGNYIQVEVMIGQLFRLAWVRQLLDADPSGDAFAQQMTAAMTVLANQGPTDSSLRERSGLEYGVVRSGKLTYGEGRFARVLPPHLLLSGASSQQGLDALPDGTIAGYFRGHDSGDFTVLTGQRSVGYIRGWQQVVQAFPHVHFWFPTRLWKISSGAVRNALDNLATEPNLALRPSALYVNDQPPVQNGWAAGTTANTPNAEVPDGVWRCPVQDEGKSSCASTRCRTCWLRKTVSVTYGKH